MPSNPALKRQKQADLCEFEANLVFKVSPRQAPKLQRNPVSKNKKTKTVDHIILLLIADLMRPVASSNLDSSTMGDCPLS